MKETRKQRIIAAAFIEHEGRVLLAQRALSKKIAPGEYHLPGGHVEFGELVPDALRRELDEELGLRVEIGEPFHVFSYATGANIHTVGIVFEVNLIDPHQEFVVDTTETESYEWVAPDLLLNYLREQDHNFAAAVKGFARLGRRS